MDEFLSLNQLVVRLVGIDPHKTVYAYFHGSVECGPRHPYHLTCLGCCKSGRCPAAQAEHLAKKGQVCLPGHRPLIHSSCGGNIRSAAGGSSGPSKMPPQGHLRAPAATYNFYSAENLCSGTERQYGCSLLGNGEKAR